MRRWRTFIFLLWGLSVSIAGAQESPFIYGIHDHDTGQQVFLDRLKANGATGWVTATIAIGSNPNDTGGGDFRSISNQGHGVIIRLNNGYCGEGTIPAPSRYDDFARRAANYVAATQGANLFVIGNETNLPAEWPIVNGRKAYVSPADYASLFRKTYDRIKAVRPDAKVLVQALAPFAGPYGAGSVCGYAHDANPINWVQYTRQMLDAIRATGGIDGIALHINSRGYFYNDIHSTQRVNAGGQSLSFSFYVYKDWVDLGIPPSLYHLPLYATEANGIYYWKGGHPERPDSHYERGWVQEVYAEINRYNQQAVATGKPVFRAVNLYRWCSHCDGWNIDGSPYENQILDDVGAAAQAGYRWPAGGTTPPPPLPPGENLARRTVAWSASSTFNASFGGDKAYDGIVSGASKWTSNGQSATSWLALDLGATYDVTGFVVRHAGAGGEATSYNTEAFRLETGSALAGPWVTESTVANASRANVSTVVLPQSKLARYVRLYITDAGIDNYARIPELEVYGRELSTPPPPPPTEPPPGTNAARTSVAWQASSTFNAASSGNKAYDGVVSEGSKWTSNGQSATSWLALDLGAKNVVTGFIVRHAGAGGEPAYFNTQAFRLERADSFAGPWTSLATVDNATQQASSIVQLTAPVETRFIRLFVTDAGIDNYARIPEFEVYSTGTVPTISSLVTNGDFSAGLNGWTTWTERAPMSVSVESGQLVEQGGNYNGGVYQQFATGGAGRKIDVSAIWSTGPTTANRQWGEILVINGSRLPVNGTDVSAANADVVLLYKNDTWIAPGGWSGPVGGASFTSAGATATIVLKSGNTAGTTTGVRFDDVVAIASQAPPPPPPNRPPVASFTATPTSGKAPLLVSFDASGSTDPDGDPLTFSWKFGDGGTGTGAQPTRTYSAAGSYAVELTVSDGRASDTASLTLTVDANLVTNGGFSSGLTGWTVWTERGTMSASVANGQLQQQSGNYNGGVYQQFQTGGAGRTIAVSAFWASGPTAANRQWGEILVINGSRLPVNGQDVSAASADVVLLYKNDTWASPSGWSGPISGKSFTSAGAVATIVLKSGNTSGSTTGVSFDDVLVVATGTAPPPVNRPPDAVLTATPTMGQAPLDVSFDGSGSSDPDNDPLTYSWTFGDGGQATGVTASHRYTSAGTFTAKLTVQDGRGGTDDATASIVVGTSQPPVLPPGCPPALHFDPIRAQLAAQGKELVHSKIGFHVGPGGSQTGLGLWMQCLDAAGVPFFLKSADAAGQIYEAAQLKAASGVPHVLVYRRSGSGFDVPDYGKAPYDAAVEHWQKHRSLFPPELEAYKHLIWVETINEIDKNRSEWLGEFALHSANLAMAEGFNWAAFGWSSGEPEPEHWRGPKMRQFLELAAQNPTRVAVAIHEYSYVTDNLTNQFPYLVGRFQQIFDAADEMGLARPTILITEFGWAYQNVPAPAQAIGVDVPWADELYSRHPEIRGAAIWYLGPGFGGISNQAQKLIAPLTEYALQNYFVIDKQ